MNGPLCLGAIVFTTSNFIQVRILYISIERERERAVRRLSGCTIEVDSFQLTASFGL
jgi:hypothetical protein